jgi:N-formylglutamate deformylase
MDVDDLLPHHPWIDCIGAPARPRTPLLIDLPHAGDRWPDGIQPTRLPAQALARWRDAELLALWREAARDCAPIVAARFDRACIDVNRARDDIDPDLLRETWPGPLVPSPLSHRGVGLLRRFAGPGECLHAERLPIADLERRLALCYDPYHETLAALLDAVHARFPLSLHLCCVSMKPVGDGLSPDVGEPRPDVAIGDLDGTSADPFLVRWLAASLQDLGLSVRINHPHCGGEVLRRHGRQVRARHSVMLMLNRRLYLDPCGPAALARGALVGLLRRFLRQLAVGLAMELVPQHAADSVPPRDIAAWSHAADASPSFTAWA